MISYDLFASQPLEAGRLGLMVGTLLALLSLSSCDLYFDVDSVPVPPDAGHDTSCVPPTDSELEEECSIREAECGNLELVDRCGEERTVDCGSCPDALTCDENRCICSPPTNQELCDDHGVEACGTLEVVDDCGDPRIVNCGICDHDSFCSDQNICEACGVDCTGKCGFVADGCGDFVDCSDDPDGESCGGGEVCIDAQCTTGDCPEPPQCDPDQCGAIPDLCGGLIECDLTCGDFEICENNSCTCIPESDDHFCAEGCGTLEVTDRCGNERTIVCGGCPAGESCQENQCVDLDCIGRDLDTDFENCGACGTACAADQTCDDGSCVTVSCEVDQGTIGGNCNPLEQTGCDGDTQYCAIRFFTDATLFSGTCRPLTDEGDLEAGDSCAGQFDCQAGLLCLGTTAIEPGGTQCYRICDLNDHSGCADDEFCTDPVFFDDPSLGAQSDFEEGLGLCRPRCSPQDPAACGPNQRCTADPAFPDATCNAQYRCLLNGGSAGKTVGSPCSRTTLNQDGCPAGTTCAPVGDNGDDICVSSCQVDDDCPQDLDCINAPSPWQALRHCEL